MVKDSFKIDFIGIGADRSGTTWLANCLAEHPEICFSKEKEIYFFNDVDRHFLKITNPRYTRGLEWYKTFFNHCSINSIKGEFSPTYMYCPVAAERIKKNFPAVKLIVVLRDPVERAFSQYLHNVRTGVIKKITFEKALEKVDSYIEKGMYFKHLAKYYGLFPKKNIKIILLDDIKHKPEAVVREVYRFLKLKNVRYLPPSLNMKINMATEAKWQWLNFIMTNTELFLKKNNLDFILGYLEKAGIRKFAFDIAHFVNVKPVVNYPVMSKRIRNKLRKVFRPDVLKLEKLLKRDLTSWKKA